MKSRLPYLFVLIALLLVAGVMLSKNSVVRLRFYLNRAELSTTADRKSEWQSKAIRTMSYRSIPAVLEKVEEGKSADRKFYEQLLLQPEGSEAVACYKSIATNPKASLVARSISVRMLFIHENAINAIKYLSDGDIDAISQSYYERLRWMQLLGEKNLFTKPDASPVSVDASEKLKEALLALKKSSEIVIPKQSTLSTNPPPRGAEGSGGSEASNP